MKYRLSRRPSESVDAFVSRVLRCIDQRHRDRCREQITQMILDGVDDEAIEVLRAEQLDARAELQKRVLLELHQARCRV